MYSIFVNHMESVTSTTRAKAIAWIREYASLLDGDMNYCSCDALEDSEIYHIVRDKEVKSIVQLVRN